MTVDRLDFSKPPLGYEVYSNEHGDWLFALEDAEEREPSEYTDCRLVVAAAWAHHKARHDPPGMWSGYCAILPLCDQYRPRMGVSIASVAHLELYAGAGRQYSADEARAAGRAAAWAWYEDALEVADLLDTAPASIFNHRGQPAPHYWPNTLTWSAIQRAEVRSWLAWHTEAGQRDSRPPTLPEALRG